MKKLLKQIITVILLLTSFSVVKAEFGIADVVRDEGGCQGYFQVLANGTAGPFEIKVQDAFSGAQIVMIEEVNGYTYFENMCEGVYEIIAYDRFGCDHFIGIAELTRDCNYILLGDEGLEANIIDFQEPTFGNCDGYVSFSLDWVNGTITQVNIYDGDRTLIGGHVYVERNNIFEDLCGAETYYVEVEVDDGCKLDVITFDLEEVCAATNINLAYIYNTEMSTEDDGGVDDNDPNGYNPVMDNCTGEIALEAVPGYTYQWSVGPDDQLGAQAYNLCKGTYEVTITDQSNNCIDIRSYRVGFEDCETPRFEKWNVGPAGLSANGFLEFMIPNGISSQFHTARLLLNDVEIASQILTPGETVRFENLGESTYKLKIFSNCGYNMRDVIIPCMLDLEDAVLISQNPIGSASGCNNAMERLSVTLPNLNDANYRWEWSTGETTQFIDVTEFAEYRLKIYLVGSECYDLFILYPQGLNGIALESTSGSCPYLSNGSAIFIVNNVELSSDFEVIVNDEVLESVYRPSDNRIRVDNLPRGSNSIILRIGICTYSYSFSISLDEDFRIEYAGVQAPESIDLIGNFPHATDFLTQLECTYNYYCKGSSDPYLTNVPEERVMIADVFSGGDNCKVDLKCGQLIIERDVQFPIRSVRVYEYERIVEIAEDVYGVGLNDNDSSNDCEHLTYCTANFEVLGYSDFLARGKVKSVSTRDDGCVRVNCEDAITGSFNYCPEDIPAHVYHSGGVYIQPESEQPVDDGYNDFEPPSIEDLISEDCLAPLTNSVAQLDQWLELYQNHYESQYGLSFYDSEFYTTIEEVMTNGYETSGCTKMTYCWPNLEVIFVEYPDEPCGSLLSIYESTVFHYNTLVVRENCGYEIWTDPEYGDYIKFNCIEKRNEGECTDDLETCYILRPQWVYLDWTPPFLGFTEKQDNSTSFKLSNSMDLDLHPIQDESENNFSDLVVKVFPSPHYTSFNLELDRPYDKDITINIYSTLGSMVHGNITLIKGETELEINSLEDNAVGLYFIQLISDGEVLGSYKVLKLD